MDEKVNIIACVPCVEGIQLGFLPYKDSVITRCEKCNCRIWLGPECAKRRKGGVPVWCMKCILKEFGPDAANDMHKLTDKKRGE